MFDGAAFGKEMVGIVKTFVEKSLAPIFQRLDALERREPLAGEKGEKGEPGEPGRDGKDGADGAPGCDGKDAVPPSAEQIAEAVAAYLTAHPPAAGKDGRDGIDGKDGAAGRDGINGNDGAPGEKGDPGERGETGAQGEPGRPGEPGAAGTDGRDGSAGKDGRDGKDGKDGVGLADAIIDRSGNLVLTMTDGRTKELGQVVGRDGRDGEKGESGKDGRDGLGFDDLEVLHDGERGFTFRIARGEHVKEFPFKLPVVIDRGVWVEGKADGYEKGDGVTWAGSFWISQKDDNTDKPDGGDGWRLSVKRGRDGKPGKDGEMKAREPVRVG